MRGPFSGSRTAQPRTPLPADVWVLVAAAFAVAIGYGLVAPVLPQYARSFDVSVTAASVVVSAFAFFRLVFAPAGGFLVDKLGERWVYMSGLLIVVVSTLATGLAQSYWQLLVFRGLGGLGSTMFTISAMALLTRLSPPGARGRIAGLYATAFLLGNIGGPVLGGLLAEFGMRVPFFVYSFTLLVATGVVAVFLRGGRRPSADDGLPEQEALPVREALRHSGYRAALVSSFVNGWSSFGVRVAIVPLFAAANFDAGPGIAGTALASFAVGTAAVISVAGWLSDRYGRRPLVIGGLLVSGVSTLVLGWCDTVPLLVAASVVAGMGAGVLNPAQQASVADVIGADRAGGKVLATFQMASDSGAILGPVLVGIVVDLFGYTAGFVLSGGLLLAAVVPWLFARETHEHLVRGTSGE
ncbi:MFS transporter [Dietzia psychralcaliphila]|uniref:Arabinose ABC transporter permease n=1 Tax=Dietzia psychralcaliphila TaxID=139021 RepID=A0AAD0JQB0_9ACTN|nr:MFS transporter [Dietzia psychralcaliphila]AWH95782.1 arabinose ABC transporter permease [Dietzia psychralcaliphila]PTM88439.1 putative MFS family arabinose efflux permease [Dietzia psychralcaliphila]